MIIYHIDLTMLFHFEKVFNKTEKMFCKEINIFDGNVLYDQEQHLVNTIVLKESQCTINCTVQITVQYASLPDFAPSPFCSF